MALDGLLKPVCAAKSDIDNRVKQSLSQLQRVGQIQQRVKEPVLVLEAKIDALKAFQKHLAELKLKENVEVFMQKKSGRDPPNLPNQI